MAQPQIAANKTKALRIGQRLMTGAKSFGKGIRNSVDSSQQVITQSARKIKSDQKRINTENKKQERFEDSIREETARRQKGMFSGGYKLADTSKKLVEKVLVDPMAAFWKIVGAWVIENLPTIIEEVSKFVKKVRIVVASINNAIRAAGRLFKGWLAIGQAWLRNMVTFDWGDSTGRLEKAQTEVEDAHDELEASWDTIYNVWGKEEEELDDMLEKLDSGATLKETVDAITKGLPVPQTPAFGGGSRDAGNNGGGQMSAAPDVAGTAHPGYQRIYKLAKAAGDPFPEVTAAQWAQESGYGKYKTGRNNPFGQTGSHPVHGHVRMATPADPGGGMKNFMHFGSEKEAVEYRVKRWTPEYGDATTPYEALMNIQKHGGNMRYAQGFPTAEMPGGDWMEYVTKTTTIIKENDMDPNRKATSAGPPDIASPQVQPAGAGNAVTGNFDLIDKIAYNDFSRTAAEGGGGSVGKTSGYGQRWGRMHYGIDIGTGGQTGYGVACNIKGKVTAVSYGSAAGNFVEIVTSDNTMYRFLHLRTAYVKQGQAYNGEVIGEIGNTGRSTGIHLHFEVAPRGGGSIDPTPWLKLLTIGRIRSRGSSSSVSSNSRANANQLNSAAASNRTNGNKNKSQVLLLNQTTYVK